MQGGFLLSDFLHLDMLEFVHAPLNSPAGGGGHATNVNFSSLLWTKWGD